MQMLRLIHSDFIKIRKTSLLWIHVIVPLLGILLFFSYALLRHADADTIMKPYIEVLGITYPFLTALICSFIADQEAEAGNFKELLGTCYGRTKCMSSKLLLVFILGLFSVVLTVYGLEGLFIIWGKGAGDIFRYLSFVIFLLFVTQIVLYLLHMFLSFQFGKGASIAAGIAEILISALMLTGLGDRIWQFIPFSYGVRITGIYLCIYENGDKSKIMLAQWNQGIIYGLSIIILSFLLFFLWFSRFEGRKDE